MRPIPVRIDVPRLERIKVYARRHGTTDAEAIRRLVDAGLSAPKDEGLTGAEVGDLHVQLRDLTDDLSALNHAVTAIGLDYGDLLRVAVESMIGVRRLVAKADPEFFSDLVNQRDRYLKLHVSGRRPGAKKREAVGSVS